MDGGRLVRCTLTYIFKDHWKSTIWTVWISRGSALIIAPYLFIQVSPIAAFIVLFIGFIASSAEKEHIETEIRNKKKILDNENAGREADQFIESFYDEDDDFTEFVSETVEVLKQSSRLSIFLPRFIEYISNINDIEKTGWIIRWQNCKNSFMEPWVCAEFIRAAADHPDNFVLLIED